MSDSIIHSDSTVSGDLTVSGDFLTICSTKTIDEISEYVRENNIEEAFVKKHLMEIIKQIIIADRLDVAEWLVGYFNIHSDDIMNIDELCCAICTCGRKEIAQWFFEKFKWCTHMLASCMPKSFYSIDSASDAAIIASRLYDNLGITKEDIRDSLYESFTQMCIDNKLSIAKSMQKDVHFTDEEVNKHKTIILKESVARDHLAVVEWLISTFNFTVRLVLIESITLACIYGRISPARVLHNKYRFTIKEVMQIDEDIFNTVCGKGHLDIAKWLVDQFHISERLVRAGRNDAFRRACLGEHFDVAEWILVRFGRQGLGNQQDYFEAFRRGCVEGSLNTVKWIDSQFRYDRSRILLNNCDPFRWACRKGHLDIVQWLIERYELNIRNICVSEHDALKWACRNDHLHVAQFLVNHFKLTRDNAGEYAVILRFG